MGAGEHQTVGLAVIARADHGKDLQRIIGVAALQRLFPLVEEGVGADGAHQAHVGGERCAGVCGRCAADYEQEGAEKGV